MKGQDRPTGGRDPIEAALLVALIIGLASVVLLAIASAFLLGMGADEAVLLSGIRGLVEQSSYGSRPGTTATSTGGLYTAAEVLLYKLTGGSVPALRLFPTLCLALLLLEMFSCARRLGASPAAALAATCVLTAVPGTTVIASTAFGAVPATLLLMWGVRVWASARTRGALVGAGCLLGLAVATRLNMLPIFPALLACAGFAATGTRRRRFLEAGLVCGIGAVVFAACSALLLLAFPATPERSLSVIQNSSGLAAIPAGWDGALNRWMVSSALTPLPLFALGTLSAQWLAGLGGETGERAAGERAAGDHAIPLVLFGWMLWILWLSVPPHPLLRYLWPALAAFAFVMGLALARLFDAEREPGRVRRFARIGVLFVAFTCVVNGCAGGVRGLLVGDLDRLSWEWRGLARIAQTPLDGRLLRDQQQIAEAVRDLPAGDRVGALGTPVAIRVLSGRPIFSLRGAIDEATPLPQWILTTPHLGRLKNIHPGIRKWLERSCVTRVRFGEYTLCHVERPFP